MKQIATMALMLNLGVASVYAHERPVRMTFSGTSAPSAINLLQPLTTTVEENVAGNGTLGPFTLRDVRAAATYTQTSSTCSGLFFPTVAGGAILRFQGGSLLTVNVTNGGDCIDLAAQEGHCTLTLQITGGTGRFKGASGTLTFTETAVPVLTDTSNTPVFFTETGELTGTISGVAREEEDQDERQ